MLINYMDLSMGHMMQRRGWLGNIRTGKSNFIAELRGMMQPLQQTIGRIYTPGCNAVLGDTRCGLDLSTLTYTGIVTSVASQRDFSDSFIVQATGYFNNGLLTWLTGANAGYKMEVKSHIIFNIVLQQAMPNPISETDTYTMSAGCDKILSTCRDKFSNVINFRGFPHIPGYDKMISGK
jgi:uncharacterized phage protein (TIGR02218 family)